jgi:hypothetical protein
VDDSPGEGLAGEGLRGEEPAPGGAAVDALLVDLARWMGDERAEEAARSRSRERWRRQQASEDAHLAGVALDLAEQGAPVALGTTTGRTHSGRILAVAEDFCVVQARRGSATLVALDAVATLRAARQGRSSLPLEAMSERTAPLELRLADALAGLAGDRPRVQLVTDGTGHVLVGELRAVGADVVTLRLDGDPPVAVYVRLASVTECSVFGSG